MSDWGLAKVKDVAKMEPLSFTDGDWIESPFIVSQGIRLIQTGNVGVGTFKNKNKKFISEETFTQLRCTEVFPGDMLICRLADPIGRACIVPELPGRFITSVDVCILRVDEDTHDKRFIFYKINEESFLKRCAEVSGGTTRQRISRSNLGLLEIEVAPKPEQRKIARILTTLDNLIEKTEALIAKYQSIKQGMMHDLFTRGVDSSGQLRHTQEQAPDLYKQSELGWIPKEWEAGAIGDFVDSLIDGPFGSNLKTEHYVKEPAVRVVRLQNISCSGYDDSDPAFISQAHANFLSRHKVVGGDVLIASLGDDNHPPGRSCLYPRHLSPAVNKADCFRLRCNPKTATNAFVSYSLNTTFVRRETKRFTQGVTLVRINGSNMKKVRMKLPLIDEQNEIVKRLEAIESTIEQQQTLEQKYRLQKSGLMQDLLTGKVRVKFDEAEEASAHA